MPAISIIVPVYNVEDYLPQCMDSIRNQTMRDIEIVCVVDGSTDRSESILRLYEKVEPRLRLVVQENKGLCAARNAGIEAAQGTYIMFADGDDLLDPKACQTVFDIFQRTGAEVVTFGAWCYPQFETTPWYENNFTPSNKFYETFHPDILFKEESHPFAWRTAVARELLIRTGLRFDTSVTLGEDQVFQFALYPKAHGVALSPKRLYHYRLNRNGSIMTSSFTDELGRLTEHVIVCERICTNWENDGLMDEYGTELALWVSEFLLPYCLRMPETDRAILVPGLRSLYENHFSVQAIDGIDNASPYKSICRELISQKWNGDIPNDKRMAFLHALVAHKSTTSPAQTPEERSALQAKLRTALPMSAAGLEYRLDNLGRRIEVLNDEQIERERKERELSVARFEWGIKEAGACARSLALLQCELLAKGFTYTL